MKIKALSFLASITLLCFTSCTDEAQELANEQSQVLKQIVMTTQDFQLESDSRTLYEIGEAIKCTWAANDTVGVFPEKGAQAYFPMASGAGTKNATFDGEGWALKDGFTYASYYPYIGKAYLDRNAVPVNYSGQIQKGNASTAHLGAYDYMVASPAVSEFGSAQFTFKHMSSLMQLRITVPQPATLTSVKLVADTKAFALEGTVDIMADAPSIVSTKAANEIVLNLQDVATTEENQVVTFYMMIPPVDLSEQTLKAVIASDKGTQEIAFEGKNFKAGTAYGLSGEMKLGEYKDGVVSLFGAGIMKQLLGDDFLTITSLKVVGPINGDDVRCLRQMLGGDEFSDEEKGTLSTLDLSEASVVVGGGWYYKYNYTSNDAIGDYMFYKCKKLKNIVLPDDVTSIGEYAFRNCSSLTSIDIPDGVTSIGIIAFYECSSLTSVYITDLSAWCNITFHDFSSNPLYEGGKLYLNHKELTELVIPSNIKSIKDYTFEGNKSLQKVIIGADVTSIGQYAFSGCSSLTTINIPDGITSIGNSTFSGCSSLTSINLPDAVTSIDHNAFSGCSSLTSIDIPDGVTLIGNSAFSGCSSLTSINLPDAVTSIDHNAFRNCSSLTSIDIPDGVTSIGQHAFSGCSSLISVDIPEGVISIGQDAFSGCSSLTSIDIPDGVTLIGNSAFSGCSSLTFVYITDLSAWCNITFSGSSSNPLYYGAKLYLNNNELTELVILEGITQIKDYAFYGCKSLQKVIIGADVTSIGQYAFYGCSSLTFVYITDLSAWCNITFKDYYSNPLYGGAKLYQNNNELTELTIPADIKKIKDYAFYGCKSIKKITMGEEVTTVGIQSFRDCSSLTQVYCNGTTPPTINPSSANSSFNGSSDGRTLYIPLRCLSAYQSSDWASFFGTIVEME